MPKNIVLGNGKTLIGINKEAELRDLYYPFVGLENHVGGRFRHRIGVFVEGKLSWTSSKDWKIEQKAGHETMSGETVAVNENLGISLEFEDVLYNEKNIFLRKVVVNNLWDNHRFVKLYFSHEFEIYESHRGDTAYYDPNRNVVIHYKKPRMNTNKHT